MTTTELCTRIVEAALEPTDDPKIQAAADRLAADLGIEVANDLL